MNDKAKKQIAIWIKETLGEDDQVPIFIALNAGEESISKIVTLKTEKI